MPEFTNSPTARKPENVLKSNELTIERKTFTLQLRENDRGKFIRIVENNSGHRSVVIIPLPGAHAFKLAFDGLLS